ncbi:MAG TPA: hypothetical protein QGF95_14585 [Candidatus Latescibacteria bacterium]|jgi:hypothetical protein|nr:hypothetical protein [Gemmatimonadaceae bacterium]MDP6016968.1 hypothetical protein [Candidatus Latescibacterota bacterium]HJP31773.1 hypothetical protein [Candidatus Latescibacterota bacterium]|tara:strand:- start:545 stop:733 length:189 start_codon:yes stop_codon:yes gene_type:complete
MIKLLLLLFLCGLGYQLFRSLRSPPVSDPEDGSEAPPVDPTQAVSAEFFTHKEEADEGPDIR